MIQSHHDVPESSWHAPIMDIVGFEGVGAHLDNNAEQVRRDLATYFGPFEPRIDGNNGSGYTGRFFDALARRGDPNSFDASAIAAVATLSVPLDGQQVAALISLGPSLSELLEASPPPGAELWEVDDAQLNDSAPLARTYELLKSIDGISYVRASKLLAAKRPDLVPVRDSVVEQLLGAKRSWWKPWKDLVSDEDLRSLVERLTPDVVPGGVSILRRLDVVLWMEGKRREAR